MTDGIVYGDTDRSDRAYAFFPVTRDDEWCGEYEPREEDREDDQTPPNLKAGDSEDLLNDLQAAQLLNTKPQTLAVWRCKKRHGLPFIRVGRSIRYRRSDIERWLQARTGE